MTEALRHGSGGERVTNEMAEQDREPPAGRPRQLRPGHDRWQDGRLHGASRSNRPKPITRHGQPVAGWSPRFALQTALRGWIENRIKECQLDLFADRTSAATMLDVRSANLMELAAALPRATERIDMRHQWVARVLANPHVDCDAVMAPFAQEVLARAVGLGRVELILDQSKLSERHLICAVAEMAVSLPG